VSAADPSRAFDAPGPAGGVLVIGYGNVLRSDDGVGVHAAGLLARDPRLARADVRAVVQLTPELAADFAEVGLVVLIDATVETAPGVIRVRPLADPEAGGAVSTSAAAGLATAGRGATGGGSTSHRVGVEELMAIAGELYGAAPEVVIVSVGVDTMEVGETLSPQVSAALPHVAEAVAALVASGA
jgi:Ni,Fe-hydrogenase maturation factor